MAETVHAGSDCPDPHGGLKRGAQNGPKTGPENDLKIGFLASVLLGVLLFPVCTGREHNFSDSGGPNYGTFLAESAESPLWRGGVATTFSVYLIPGLSGITLKSTSQNRYFRLISVKLRPVFARISEHLPDLAEFPKTPENSCFPT